MLTEKEKEYIKKIKEDEIGLPIHFVLDDEEKGTLTFYFKGEREIPIFSKVTYKQAKEQIVHKGKVELVNQICKKMLFETGDVPDIEIVKEVLNTIGLKPEEIAKANTYDTLHRCVELLMKIGPAYRATKIYMDEKGTIIAIDGPALGYIKPSERILKTF